MIYKSHESISTSRTSKSVRNIGSQNQSIADRVAQHLEIISKNFRFSTRTRILMGLIIYYLVLIVNPIGGILVRRKSFKSNLKMLCDLTCNWLYLDIYLDLTSYLDTWIEHMSEATGSV